ncbi:AbrB/MazE/SpoVT family DNA-binding domain-containing protein [Patescibacteria group bacterium]|nr:MAG: AbrB/MazE/SpoVT family DNA-binding domain-containing protein [Patescibacteria group bacterium]
MDNIQIAKVIRVGNSNAVVIPKNICRALGVERGDQVAFGVYNDNEIIIRRISSAEVRALKPRNISYE